MKLPSRDSLTDFEYEQKVFDAYVYLFGEPAPMEIIQDFAEVEKSVETEVQITEDSKGWDGEGTYF